jgi:hypothetical protein
MAADPAALQLRLLHTVVEVAAEKNSTLVMPFPVELLRFFDNAAPAQGRAQAAADDAGTADGTPQPTDVPALTGANPPVGVSLAGQLNGVPMAPAGQPRLLWPLLPFFVLGVQGHRGLHERAARPHLGGDPDGLHDLLIGRASRGLFNQAPGENIAMEAYPCGTCRRHERKWALAQW